MVLQAKIFALNMSFHCYLWKILQRHYTSLCHKSVHKSIDNEAAFLCVLGDLVIPTLLSVQVGLVI